MGVLSRSDVLAILGVFSIILAIVVLLDDKVPLEVSMQVGNPVQVDYDFRESVEDVDRVYSALMASASDGSIKFETLKGKKFKKDRRVGFHYYQNRRCFIVMVKPSKISYDEFEKTLGHEMLHCLFGEFHDAEGSLPSQLIIKLGE